MRSTQKPSALTVVNGSERSAPVRSNDSIPPFAALRAFDAVARAGGMRRAAVMLGVDHTVVSRHIQALEKWMGIVLVERAEGMTRLTEPGRRYHARISSAIAEIVAATTDARRQADLDRIRIWCVPGFGFQWLAPQLADFRAKFPKCQSELHPTDDSPDFGHDDADVDIRFIIDGAEPAGLKHVRSFEFARPPVIVVVSPQLAVKLSKVTTPADLLTVPLIHEADDTQWQAWFHRHGVQTPSRIPGIRVWHAHVGLEAARNGEGVAQANSFLIRDDLINGRLMLLGPKTAPGFPVVLGGYRLSSRESQWNLGSVRRFRHWLLNAVANHHGPL
jgi:DNA-binding transcriptional LysR family regulator